MVKLSRVRHAAAHGLWAFLSGWALSASAQVEPAADTAHFLVELITVEDGLPQGMVQCVLQDRTGYMWFGTRGGLARSDGYRYTIYQHDDKDSTSIGSNIVSELLEDRDGLLWLGFENGALDRFDPRTGAFTHVAPDHGPGDIWPAISALLEDRKGNIWFFAMSGGLHVVRPSAVGTPPVAEDPHHAFPDIQWPERILAFTMAGNGELWVAFGDSLMVLDPRSQHCLARVRASYITEQQHLLGPLHWMTPDGDGTGVWLIRDGELYHFARKDSVLDGATVAYGRKYDSLDRVKEIQGRVWLGGMLQERFVPTDARMESFRFTEIHGKRLKAELGMICWTQDRSGTIWAGTNGYGVLKITRMRQRFHHLPDAATVFRASSSGAVALIMAGDDRCSDASGRITTAKVNRTLHAHGLMLNPNVWAMDPRGSVWVNSAPQWGIKPKLTVIDPSGELRFPHIVPDSLATRSIFPGQGDELWAIAVMGPISWTAAVALLRIDTRQERLLRQYPFPFTGWDYNDVASVEMDRDGSIWLVTKSGLLRLDPNTGAWEHIRHSDADPRSIPTDRLVGMCFDPQDPVHLLWIGTGGSGLVKLDRRSGVVERYTTKEGLPSNVVYGILPDERGNLWFGTDMGLCRFDPRTKDLKRYTYEDGLIGNEFNTRAAGATADGRMFFGGPMGTTWFRPAEFYEVEPACPTVITGLRLADQEVVAGSFTLPGADRPLLDRAVEYTRTITLPYDERMLTFTFACMDHTLPGKNTFRYQLEGFSAKWFNAGTTHEATFTHLDPGTYTFRVQGCNSAGVWDEQGASIQLILTPPWWGTWWFRIASAVLILAALYGFYRYRLFQALKVVRVRERIARDLHDEIGSTLSSVQLYSAVAQRKANEGSSETAALLGHVTEGTTSVLEAMNDIVWAVNAGNDNMARVSQRMNSYAMRITDAKECELELKVQEDLLNDHLGMTQRRNLYLVFKEAVNNAVKYSDCTTLTIELLKEGTTFILRVTDNGKGFDAGAAAAHGGLGGNGLGNMHRRAEEMGGSLELRCAPGMGTTVELRFKANERKSRVSLTTRDSGRR